ncbi:RiPP maturation radical SAM C-methyltransferase, partial [Nonomuraea monospora]|uniref:RiPP maturation radical SAM C-methyltransferase n=1 Tax=Nonomuraea monospora TaxID=568818 RepID=UPI0031E1A499
ERYPLVKLVYGGANFDGEMGCEYARGIGWIDYVVTGEGDIAFPHLLNAIADGTEPLAAGIQRPGALRTEESPRVRDLNALPVPEYSDYFTTLARLDAARVLGDTVVKLPVEFSRGCWWGAKHHCTFCGLNALGMSFRAKSGDRAVAELSTMIERYQVVHIEAVDNILDMKYLDTFCADLAEQRWDMSIFYEVKANLTREQIGLLARAGIHRIQPGIESLSTNVLRLMRKGATKLINVRLLKWARYHGVSVQWNVLTGFPGESDDDYREQAGLLPLLHHLQPPVGGGRIWLERFSPYFTDPSFPIKEVRPRASYRHIYPPDLDHHKIAYFFDYEAESIASPEAHQALASAIGDWRQRWNDERKPSLIYQRLPNRLTIIDKRGPAPRKVALTGWQAAAYQHCDDTARAPHRVRERLAEQGYDVPEERIDTFLEACCRAGVMIAEDRKYLALALPENPGW